MDNTAEILDYNQLLEKNKQLVQKIQELEYLRHKEEKEKVIVVREKRELKVDPPNYKQDMARLRELEKKVKQLERVIQFGNISTVSTIITEFKRLSVSYFERLSNELYFYSICAEENEELEDFVEYLNNVSIELQKFLLVKKGPIHKKGRVT